MAEFTVAAAFRKARAAEKMTQEAKTMQEPSQVTAGQEEDMHKLSIHFTGKCYRCGKQGHSAVECKRKRAKCQLCQKAGHLARLKYIMLLKLIILSGNSFNFYLLFPKLFPTFYYKSIYTNATRAIISYL